MIVQLAASSPAWLRAAASGVLILHIGSAGVGLLSGAGALIAAKGGPLHRTAGHVFFVSMLAMSAIGAATAVLLPQLTSTVMGLFTFYLVATGWMAAHRRDGRTGLAECAGLAFALAIAATGVALGLKAAHSPSGMLDGDPPAAYYILAALPALAALADGRLLLRGELSGPSRIRRHIWRLCAALLIAAFSLFIGQPKVFPPMLRGSPVMFVPELAVLGVMIFWLLRTRTVPHARMGAAGVILP